MVLHDLLAVTGPAANLAVGYKRPVPRLSTQPIP
jgi:hypothetical protein